MELTQRLQSLKQVLSAAGQRSGKVVGKPLQLLRKQIHLVRSSGSYARLYAATLTAGVILIGGSYVAIDRIHSTQSWISVYSNGAFVGVVPDQSAVASRLIRTAEAYNVKLDLYPVHTHVGNGYDWHGVASLPMQAVAIRSNGHSLVYVKNQKDAQSVLNQVKTALVPKSMKLDAKVQFVGKVDLVSTIVSASSILNTSAAVQYLLNPAGKGLVGRSASPASVIASAIKSQSTTQKKGQARYAAIRLDVPTVRGGFLAQNSSAAAGSPSGQILSGTDQDGASGFNNHSSGSGSGAGTTQPLVSVKVVETLSKSASVPFPIHYVKTVHLGLGAIQVVDKGVPGKVEELVQVTYVNGRKASEKVLAKRVLSAPHAEVADKGTNPGIAAGAWGWPTDRYDITSGFGWRILYGRENFHPGFDIGVPIGSPVYATNNGVVVQAGWNSGGYGNWIMIDNGHGIQTVFGHLSRVLVHVGETVAKGDLIGKSGDTGFSTGPHLHYEVRVNGVAVNPHKYM